MTIAFTNTLNAALTYLLPTNLNLNLFFKDVMQQRQVHEIDKIYSMLNQIMLLF